MTRGYETAQVLNVLDFGADPSGVSLSDTAFATAAGLLQGTNNQGRQLYLPPGVYKTSTTLNLASATGITITGPGGAQTGGALAGARIIYTGATGPVVNGQNSVGLTLRGIQFHYNNAGFSGNVIDLRNLAGSDTAFATIDQCNIGGLGVNGAVGVNFDKCIESGMYRTNVFNCSFGVQGKSAAGTYSNAITIGEQCQFVNNVNGHVNNVGQGWLVQGATFEQLTGGPAGAFTHAAGVLGQGVTIQGCWFGDVSTSGTQISWGGKGLQLVGNYIGLATGVTGFLLDTDNSHGIAISGNHFDAGTTAGTCVDFGLGRVGTADVMLWGNEYTTTGTKIAHTPAGTVLTNATGEFML